MRQLRRHQLLARYQERTGRDIPNILFYYCFALFKSCGVVQQIYYRGGELVPAGKPILALLPPGNLKVRFFVNEANLPKLKFGDPVTVTCDGCERDITANWISRLTWKMRVFVIRSLPALPCCTT